MAVRGTGRLLLFPLAALLAGITGVCRGGAARFYTTNTLTEVDPRLPRDYDALLDQVSGDFGVRSEVVAAAGQEPEYRGADTMVVPLYIPKGAVPIRVARIARSDAHDPVLELVDLTVSSAADSVLIRRIGPVDGRRGASPPTRAAWRPPQRTRISRLPVLRRSDSSSPRRRVTSTPSSSSSHSLSPALPPDIPILLPLSMQSEFGKRLASSLSTYPPVEAERPDTATKRAKKNELSKDSQFPDELHTTSVPLNASTTAASPVSPPPSERDAEIQAPTRRFSTHITTTTTTTTTTAAVDTPTTSTTTESPPATSTPSLSPSSTTTTFTTKPRSTTTTTPQPSATTDKSTTTTTTTVTTTTTPPPQPTVTSNTAEPSASTTTFTSTTTSSATSTTTTTTTTTPNTRVPSSSTTSTSERKSILFPRPVESILKIGRSATPPSTTTTTTPSTTTTTPTTTTTTGTDPTTTATGGRSFSLPVRALPSWVIRGRASPPSPRRGSTTTPPSPPSTTATTTSATTTSTTTSTTTTTTARPHRVRDKLRRLSRLRTGLNTEPSTTTPSSTTERSQVTTPMTSTVGSREPQVTARPSTTPKRTSPLKMMPSVSDILSSRLTEEDWKEGHEGVLDATVGRPSTTEAYEKTSTTTLKSEVEQLEGDEGPTEESDKEVGRTQLPRLETEDSVSQEQKSPPSGTTRKFVRRPRPPVESEKGEEHVRPSGHRRRRPLRPRIKLAPPITYHSASTTPPQDNYASTSTTTTTTLPTTTTTIVSTSTQQPYRTTVTVTLPSTPRVVLTTTTTTTTTTPPPTTTTATITTPTKTPEQVVIESLTEIMKQATNTSRSKDKVYNIAANLEDLNKRLAEQGIHIIHAEVDGVKIKLDNRTITRPRPLPVTTFRPYTAYLPSTLASSPSYPSSSPAPSQTTTPDAQDKNIHTSIRSSFSFHASRSPDTANEVQTTPSEARKPDENPFLAPSRLPTTEEGEENPARNSTEPSTPSVGTSGTRSSLDLEGRLGGASTAILATATVPTTVTTRTRSTTVPVTTHHPATTPFLRLHPATDPIAVTASSTHEDDESPAHDSPRAPTTVHPTSHHRPTFLPRPTDHSDTADTSETTHVPTIKIISILEKAELPGSAATVEGVEEDMNDLQDLKDPPRTSYTSLYVISVIGVIPAAGLAFFIARRFLKKTQKALPESEERGEGFTPITHHSRKTQASSHAPTLETEGPSSVEAKNPRFTPWEFPRSKLRLASILGQGNFGVVWKAEARDLCACEGSQGGPTVLVAVKGVKEGAGAKEKQDLLKELAIMQHLGQHINVVTLLGCCTQQEPYHVIMEYVMFGKLLTFLRDHRTRQNYYNFSSDTAALTSHDLTRFACQVAAGCEYIQSRGIIHRDLASRNVLVDHNKVCKIADFGLARSVKDLGSDIYEQKSRGALPIRWMAPESLYMSIFTHKSDVWSLGILCWEIVTLGSTPYPGMTAREVMRKVREGYRLERPEHCRPELYHIVTRCWHQDLNQRPSFTEIKEDLLELLDNSPTGYIDLENFPENSYYSMHENNDEKL